MKVTKLLKTLVLALAAGSFTASAVAQWQWMDKDGRKVFSDRPPPSDILEKNILKRPGGLTASPAAAPALPQGDEPAPEPTGTAAPAAPKTSAPKLPAKDAQLEARKKAAEDQEAAKKKASEEKAALARGDNCERAKKALATMQSGMRVSVTNAKGEREFMDDNARATEVKRLQGIADNDCKK